MAHVIGICGGLHLVSRRHVATMRWSWGRTNFYEVLVYITPIIIVVSILFFTKP